jgi:hypothetical protein
MASGCVNGFGAPILVAEAALGGGEMGGARYRERKGRGARQPGEAGRHDGVL